MYVHAREESGARGPRERSCSGEIGSRYRAARINQRLRDESIHGTITIAHDVGVAGNSDGGAGL